MEVVEMNGGHSGIRWKSRSPAAFRRVIVILLITCAGLLPACGEEEIFYLLQQAPGQLALLMDRVPFEKVLADPELDPEVRKKLEFVLEVKRYGVDEIGLLRNRNYEVYVELDREAANWNLTAAYPLAMEPVTWDFPVVGRMPYLGFFKKDNAIKKKEKLEAQGYDVYVRTAGAYSMLGIIADPLYSPLVKMRDEDLANLIIHEMLHSTVFIKGQMEFNENLALFVGNQGSYNYLAGRFGEDSEQARYAVGSNLDDNTFSIEIMKLHGELDEMYKSGISDDEKKRRKQEIIEAHKKRFREEVLPDMHTTAYRRWPELDINNATVISRAVYYHDLSLYHNLYMAMDEKLSAVLDFFREVQQMEGVDAEGYAREWLEKRADG
jgi:predicted aminopeptidase